MTKVTDLLASIQTALGIAGTLGYSNSTAAHDVYEGYILSLFCRAASATGWQIDLRDSSGASTKNPVFRMGPGRLPSGNYTHVHLSQMGKQPLEAHIGVKVAGRARQSLSKKTRSGHILHEFDLLVLPSQEADKCRKTNDDPHHLSTIVHAEAKFYSSNLSLPIGRSIVGLTFDCKLCGKSVLVTNQNSTAVQDLVNHYGVAFFFLIMPSNRKGEYHLIEEFKRLLHQAP